MPRATALGFLLVLYAAVLRPSTIDAFFIYTHLPLHPIPFVKTPSVKQQQHSQQQLIASSSGVDDSKAAIVSARRSSTSGRRQYAKDAFLRNLERKRAGKSVPNKVLDTDISNLVRQSSTTKEGRYSWTTVADLPSWRGTWKISHAPHIETLGALLFSSFPSVEYHFTTNDGRMVSQVRYESGLFGSGWLSADGRVVPLPAEASEAAGTDRADNSKSGLGTVQVIFERFWWDRNGEETPSRAPPAEGDGSGAGGDILSWLVQAVGKALFVKDLSVFPVLYLDDDLCVFEFKAAGTVVVSERIG